MDLSRFGVSMEHELAEMLDRLVDRQGYANRSEALRAMVRKELAHHGEDDDDREVAGIVTLLYPAGTVLKRRPTAGYPSISIAANLQLHLKDSVCLKLIVVQGLASQVREWAGEITSQRGIVGELTVVASDGVFDVFADSGQRPGASSGGRASSGGVHG
jgi:CopG family nickel-responsive transcriptional regulator